MIRSHRLHTIERRLLQRTQGLRPFLSYPITSHYTHYTTSGSGALVWTLAAFVVTVGQSLVVAFCSLYQIEYRDYDSRSEFRVDDGEAVIDDVDRQLLTRGQRSIRVPRDEPLGPARTPRLAIVQINGVV